MPTERKHNGKTYLSLLGIGSGTSPTESPGSAWEQAGRNGTGGCFSKGRSQVARSDRKDSKGLSEGRVSLPDLQQGWEMQNPSYGVRPVPLSAAIGPDSAPSSRCCSQRFDGAVPEIPPSLRCS